MPGWRVRTWCMAGWAVGLMGLVVLGVDVQAAPKKTPIPGDLALVNALKKTWEKTSCTGELNVQLAGQGTVLAAPLAISYSKDVLSWVAFITPPTPCSGSVVLGGVRLGPGNQPAVMMGVPPGLVVGGGPSTLQWKKLENKEGENAKVNVGGLCGAQGGGSDELFSGFAGGMGDRPESRSWDEANPTLLKLEGKLKGKEKSQQGRYAVWLDKSRGYLPVRNEKWPEQGAHVVTTWEPKEVTPGHWLPVKWETVAPGRPSMIGEIRNLRCDRPISPEWFKQSTYPDLAAEKPILQQLQAK